MKRILRKLKICMRVFYSPLDEFRTEVTMDLFDACNLAYSKIRHTEHQDAAVILGKAMRDITRGLP